MIGGGSRCQVHHVLRAGLAIVAAGAAGAACSGSDGDAAGGCAWGRAASGTCDDAVEISAGQFHTCARRASGAVVCRGRNDGGQLGDGTTTQHARPVAVVGVVDAVELSAGESHTCARRASGAVVCWGRNDEGQLGDGRAIHISAPVPVAELADAVAVSAGGLHTCARRASGSVVCWGWNKYGQLGDGTSSHSTCDAIDDCSLTPVAVSGLTDAVEVAAGYAHTCAVRASGTVVCWGIDQSGELGDGTTTDHRSIPVDVPGLTDVAELSAGQTHTCARHASGDVACWGWSKYGQLGDGLMNHSTCASIDCSFTPVAVSALIDALEIAAGQTHTCARRAAGAVVCWGSNTFGKLGDGAATHSMCPFDSSDCALTPVSVSGLIDALELSAGQTHTCARSASSAVVCWGQNGNGELGDGTTANRPTPVAVVSP